MRIAHSLTVSRSIRWGVYPTLPPLDAEPPGQSVTLDLCPGICLTCLCILFMQRWHRTDFALPNKVCSCLVICWIILIMHEYDNILVSSWSKLNDRGEKRNCAKVNKIARFHLNLKINLSVSLSRRYTCKLLSNALNIPSNALLLKQLHTREIGCEALDIEG